MSEEAQIQSSGPMSLAEAANVIVAQKKEIDALTKQCDALALELRERVCDYECDPITCTRAPTCGNAHEVLAGQAERVRDA